MHRYRNVRVVGELSSWLQHGHSYHRLDFDMIDTLGESFHLEPTLRLGNSHHKFVFEVYFPSLCAAKPKDLADIVSQSQS